MALTLTYDSTLGRIQLAAASLAGTAVTATFERSTDQITWTTVRGGTSATVSGSAASLDDYEFAADVVNYYRCTAYDATPTQVDQQSANTTVMLTSVWLKSIAQPFLNREVVIRDLSDIGRASRSGVFDVIGRSYPVAVTDVRSARRFSLDLRSGTQTEADDIDLLIAGGDLLFIQPPASGYLANVPTAYVAVGDYSRRWLGPPTTIYVHTLACIEIAAPGADVIGATATWQAIVNNYATWSDVIAAFATWADVADYVASPSDVLVS